MTTELERRVTDLRHGDHICPIYDSMAEQLAWAVPFLNGGLARGERCLYVADDRSVRQIVRELTAAGVDVEGEIERGALRLLTKQDTYVRGGAFDPHAMIDFLRQTEAEAMAAGFTGHRVLGEMTWALGPEVGGDRLVEYEALLNTFLQGSRSLMLCQYNRQRFDPAILHDVLRTHPVVVLGADVCPNPYYEPPQLVLAAGLQPPPEFKAQRFEWWIAQLQRAREMELERRRAEAALRVSEERFRSAFTYAAVGMKLVAPDGRMQQVNAAYCAMTGYTEAELLATTSQAITHPDDLLEFDRQFRRLLAGEIASFVMEKRYRRKGGDIAWERGSSALVRDAQGQPLHVVTLAEDITERKAAEAELQSYARRLQLLSRQLLEVQEAERRHLARELHDEIGQLLTALRLLLKPGGSDPGQATDRAEEARGLVDDLLQRVRSLSFELRPAALDQLGLVPALLALFERYTALTAVLVDFKHQGAERRFSADVETAAYRLVQEALTNIARHAAVAGATVRVWTSADALHVRVADRGRGFDPQAAMAAPHSSGLAGMRERVALLGGRLVIESRPGHGTEITAELPWPQPEG